MLPKNSLNVSFVFEEMCPKNNFCQTPVQVCLSSPSHPPSQGWSPTIPWMVNYNPKGCHPTSLEWLPIFSGWSYTIPKPKQLHDGYPPFQGWSPTIRRMVNPPSVGWSSTIRRMVTHHPQDGHPPSVGWSPPFPQWLTIIPMMFTHHPHDSHPPFQEWSPTLSWIGWSTTIPRMVTNHPQDCHHHHLPPQKSDYLFHNISTNQKGVFKSLDQSWLDQNTNIHTLIPLTESNFHLESTT